MRKLVDPISLCRELEEANDERAPAHRIVSTYSFDLPFPHHVHRFE
jgi:hypothetical protein